MARPALTTTKAKTWPGPRGRWILRHFYVNGEMQDFELPAMNQEDALLAASVNHGLTQAGWKRNLFGTLTWEPR